MFYSATTSHSDQSHIFLPNMMNTSHSDQFKMIRVGSSHHIRKIWEWSEWEVVEYVGIFPCRITQFPPVWPAITFRLYLSYHFSALELSKELKILQKNGDWQLPWSEPAETTDTSVEKMCKKSTLWVVDCSGLGTLLNTDMS